MLFTMYLFSACLSSHITTNATCRYRYSQKAMDGNNHPPVPLLSPFVSDIPHNGNPGAILPHDGNPDAPGPLLVEGCTIKGIEGVTGPMREHVIVFYTKFWYGNPEYYSTGTVIEMFKVNTGMVIPKNLSTRNDIPLYQ
jgi:hypothetical protein